MILNRDYELQTKYDMLKYIETTFKYRLDQTFHVSYSIVNYYDKPCISITLRNITAAIELENQKRIS